MCPRDVRSRVGSQYPGGHAADREHGPNMGIPGACDCSVAEPVTGKRVLLAEPRGYCAGVDRAVETVERALEKHGPPALRAPRDRAQPPRGRDAGQGGRDLRRRDRRGARGRHRGVLRARRRADRARDGRRAAICSVIDATCPLVTKVHNEAKRFARDDYDILLIGHEGHEEVIGTAGEAPDHVQLVDGPDAVDGVTVRDEDKVIWLSQTTLSRRRDDGDRGAAAGSASRSCRTRPATTSATRPRTARSRSRRWRRSASW